MVVPALLVGGGIVVAGVAAGGFLAEKIGGILDGLNANKHFESSGELQNTLISLGRPELAADISRSNAGIFDSSTSQTTGAFGDIKDIIPLAIIGFLIFKGAK